MLTLVEWVNQLTTDRMGTMIFGMAAGGIPVSKARGARGKPTLDLTSAVPQFPAVEQAPSCSKGRFAAARCGAGSRSVVGSPAYQKGQRTRCKALKSHDSTSRSSDVLQPGILINYRKDDKHILALVMEPDGKKNWWIVDQRGRRFSLPARTVSLVLPGGNFLVDDVRRFAAAAEAADMSLLEVAWAIATEEPRSYSLAELATLLFNEHHALPQYITFCMLLHDEIYFKPAFKGGVWSFEPRSAEAVEVAEEEAAAEAASTAAKLAFQEEFAVARAAAAKARPVSVPAALAGWKQGPHWDKVAALLDFALTTPGKCPEQVDSLARNTLQLLRRRPEPDVAVAVLTEAGLLRLHEPIALRRIGRNTEVEFQPRLEQAAQALLSDPPPDPDACRRLDLTHLTVYTVDDASTTEVDDGLSVTTDEAGNRLLWVHVADPTRWITPGDVFDVEARNRSRTLYFPFGAIPMFPRALAEGPFSLGASSSSINQAPETCCAFSVCASLNADGSLQRVVHLTPSTISVSHRLTYDAVDADLGLGPGMCQYEDLQVIYAAARLRRSWRVSRGCIDIDLPESKFEVSIDELDNVRPAVTCTKLSQWESAARTMIAEMMILAGEAVGTLGAQQRLPLPYRGQEAPQLPPQEMLDALPEGPCQGYALRRCMTRSVIEAAPVRHASLALDAYVQFTSPIRRYSDIMTHFNIKAYLRGQPLPFPAPAIASISNSAVDLNRELGRAEGEVNKYWAAEYLRQRGSQGWPALVLGWFKAELNLIAVSLEDLGLEAIVKVEFPVEAGDQVLLKVAEVDVKGGFYRLYVEDRLSSYSSSRRSEAAETGQAQEELAEQELEQLLLRDLAGDAAGVGSDAAGSGDDSDEPQGVLRWRSAVSLSTSSGSSSDQDGNDDTGLVFGSFTSNDVGSEVLSFDKEQLLQQPMALEDKDASCDQQEQPMPSQEELTKGLVAAGAGSGLGV